MTLSYSFPKENFTVSICMGNQEPPQQRKAHCYSQSSPNIYKINLALMSFAFVVWVYNSPRESFLPSFIEHSVGKIAWNE